MNKHYILQALNEEGKSVFIDDVPNGKNCGCHCKECGGNLIARQGNIKAHHFAHASGNDSIKCSMTALHLLAEEIIFEEKKIPAFVNGNIEFVEVKLIEKEKNLGDIKPDLYTEYEGKPVAVEIFVSHKVDEIKFEKIQNHKLTTFEINLSDLDFETKEDVRKAIYDFNNLRPIYDDLYTKKALENKKQFIDTNGIVKRISNDKVFQCPLNIVLSNDMRVICDSIKSKLCERCPFGYRTKEQNTVHCIGHFFNEFSKNLFLSKISNKNIHIFVPYDWRIDVTNQKISTLYELAEYFSSITNRKFTVSSRKKSEIKK